MTEPNEREALLPCPFCGGSAGFGPYKRDGLVLKCMTLGCVKREQRTLRKSIEWLREAMTVDWNRRAALSTPPAAVQPVRLSLVTAREVAGMLKEAKELIEAMPEAVFEQLQVRYYFADELRGGEIGMDEAIAAATSTPTPPAAVAADRARAALAPGSTVYPPEWIQFAQALRAQAAEKAPAATSHPTPKE